MKKIIGIIIVLLAVSFIGVLTLRLWGIYLVSLDTIINSSITLVVLGVLIIILIITYGGLFKNNSKGYNKESGNRAHPKL